MLNEYIMAHFDSICFLDIENFHLVDPASKHMLALILKFFIYLKENRVRIQMFSEDIL
jgi:hypothetical protein